MVIDEKLAQIIQDIQAEFPLLSKSEAVKLAISRGSQAHKQKTFHQILHNSSFLDIPEEDAQFAFIKKHLDV